MPKGSPGKGAKAIGRRDPVKPCKAPRLAGRHDPFDPRIPLPERVEIARRAVGSVLKTLVEKVPSIPHSFYWAGTAALSYEETEHWVSMDIDLHSLEPFANVEPVARRILAIPGVFKARPADFKSGLFFARTRTESGDVTIDVLSSYEKPGNLIHSRLVPVLLRQTLGSYIRNKVQCIEERGEQKDWLHLALIGSRSADLEEEILSLIRRKCDPLILCERLNDVENQDPSVETPGITDSEIAVLRLFFNKVRSAISSNKTILKIKGVE